MASLKDFKNTHVEYAFIGASTTNLLLAYVFKSQGKTPFIFEPLEEISAQTEAVHPNNFNLIKDKPEHRELLQWVEATTNAHLQWTKLEAPTTTMVKSELIPFLGFAEESPTSIDVLSHYIGSHWLSLSKARTSLRQFLLSSLQDHIYTLSEVSDWHIKEKQVTAITLNGNKTLSAKYFFSSEFPTIHSDIKELLPKKLTAKFRPWTAVQISISHAQVDPETWPTTPGYILIPGGKKSDFQPCIGQFSQPADHPEGQDPKYSSFWRGFAPADVEEDSDYMGGLVRHLKKSLKKVLPFDEKNSSLKVIVTPYSNGHFADISNSDPFLQRGAFICTHPFLSPYEDLIGDIDTAQRLLSSEFFQNHEKTNNSNELEKEPPVAVTPSPAL